MSELLETSPIFYKLKLRPKDVQMKLASVLKIMSHVQHGNLFNDVLQIKMIMKYNFTLKVRNGPMNLSKPINVIFLDRFQARGLS